MGCEERAARAAKEEVMIYEEPMPWMTEQMLSELGLKPKSVDDKTNPKTAIDRQPRDVSWYKRGEECPH